MGSGDENQGQRRYLASYQVSLLPNLILWVRKGKETSEIGQAWLVGLEKARDMPDVMRRDSPASGFGQDSKENMQMCEVKTKNECEHPEKLRGQPKQCTPEQIRGCHGELKKHPCVQKK